MMCLWDLQFYIVIIFAGSVQCLSRRILDFLFLAALDALGQMRMPRLATPSALLLQQRILPTTPVRSYMDRGNPQWNCS